MTGSIWYIPGLCLPGEEIVPGCPYRVCRAELYFKELTQCLKVAGLGNLTSHNSLLEASPPQDGIICEICQGSNNFKLSRDLFGLKIDLHCEQPFFQTCSIPSSSIG